MLPMLIMVVKQFVSAWTPLKDKTVVQLSKKMEVLLLGFTPEWKILRVKTSTAPL